MVQWVSLEEVSLESWLLGTDKLGGPGGVLYGRIRSTRWTGGKEQSRLCAFANGGKGQS